MLLIYLLMVFVLFPAVALVGCRITGKKYTVSFFPKTASAYWRGIAAFMVIFAHLTILLHEKGINVSIAKVYEWVGGTGVLIFFFISGYGTTISIQNKKIDLQWLVTHFLRLWLPVTIIRCFLWFGYRNDFHNSSFLLFLLYSIGAFNPAWFVNVLLSIYVSVYISKRYFPKYFLLALFLLNLFSGTVFYALGFEERWYNSHLLYVFGAFVAMQREGICTNIRKRWGLHIIINAIIFFGFALLYTKFKPTILSAVFKLLSGSGLCLLIIVLSQKVKKYGSIMMKFGEMSLYLYIIHSGLYPILDKIWPQEPFGVVFLSIAIAIPVSAVCLKLESIIKKVCK